MKRIVFLVMILTLVTTVVSAQRLRANRGQLTRSEVRVLRNDQRHFKIARRVATRDGFVSPRERRRLAAIKRDERRDRFRFRHNRRRRLI